MNQKEGLQEATFAAGCFWHVQDAFDGVKGVVETEVGFMGGHTISPSYKQVCTHTTGHAEVVHLWFDPKVVGYKELVEFFWTMHDPTQVNRQGPDVGDQYRSAIFYYGGEQRAIAEDSKKKLNASGTLGRPVATEITAASTFWRAEDYHQKYFKKHGISHCPA
ncbi:MAG TPA: peptide-methionine (S)-S-oxide reductase MsrA [Methanomassiliicoccales archaeon]|nr:peptide-methionine (S)-S-oxide reductase MsrA [Methanomassiliicoccales archaeon]